MADSKKLAFYEIGGGILFKEMQGAFEQAQLTARDENGTVVVTLKVSVLPPELTDGRFGHVSFTVGVKNPDRKSANFTTELNNGVIVNTGDDLGDLLQTSLELPQAIPFAQRKEVENGK
jgi:hypothetical protein